MNQLLIHLVDLGRLLAKEAEEAVEPVTKRLDEVLDQLRAISRELDRLNDAVEAVQPVIDFVKWMQQVRARLVQRLRRD